MPPNAQSPIPIWLTRDRSLPIHDQLVTQVLLGILSDDLKPMLGGGLAGRLDGARAEDLEQAAGTYRRYTL